MKKPIDTIETASGYFVEALTKREKDFAPLLIKGLKVVEIQKTLKLARRTADFHIDNMKSKLHCNTLYELGVRLAELDILKEDELGTNQ